MIANRGTSRAHPGTFLHILFARDTRGCQGAYVAALLDRLDAAGGEVEKSVVSCLIEFPRILVIGN